MKHKIVLTALIILLASYFWLFSWYGGWTAYETTFYGNRSQDSAEAIQTFNLSNQSSILYLEPGDAPYFFHINSSCRFIAPLVVIRNRDDWNTTNLPQYWQEYNCIAQYQGQYIIMELGNDTALDWFGENQKVRQPLLKIIWNNYTVVYAKSWRVLEKNQSSLSNSPSAL